ncbi:site-specific DNA-methyltransferase [Dethiosulfovibrio sp. F2B]|uniref:DNA methyltransferase n=1 Tax=Dethiosulfovibrio faecalis TaxID=2720018 RepID=UPI001F24C15E|nr:DNA methyltransferase [Dethiosulfovibrio faecalis]MCF4150286.1 site-specific DNA-methyltransferase [Dethiosulfovibrio faecalis]
MIKKKNLLKKNVALGKPDGGNLFDEEVVSDDGPVKCLGLEFENDDARRAHFTEELRKKLQDPEFRKIEGFPIGEDEDILKLSDPPYYTACPNPWIADFIDEWERQKPEKPADYHYHREPFAADVSEGKNDPIYNAHSYHTKVPHKAIMRYILHYTEPGDIVFDGFCGTGMTGVAAQMCGDRDVVTSLGYQVKPDGTILQEETDEDGKKVWKPFSKLGARKAVLNDLSPAATFIAYNYNTPVDVYAFEREAKRILAEVEEECGWMYETLHTDGKTKGKINYAVWSDVFVCPECAGEVVFWDAAVDKEAGKVRDSFPCPHCHAELTKRKMERAWTTKFDSALNDSVKQAKQVPVIINYSIKDQSGRFEKSPDKNDLTLIEKIENSEIHYWFPNYRMMKGKETRRNDPAGITHVHHFYTKRNLCVLAAVRIRSSSSFLISQLAMWWTLTKLYRYRWAGGIAGAGGGPMAGTLYIPSLIKEISVLVSAVDVFNKNIRKKKLFANFLRHPLSTSSANWIDYNNNSVDYIFTDPPFGANLNYSELSFIWESWLKVWTNNVPEAIENSVQGKGATEYRNLMAGCFKEAYRVLKPGRWMTVEFSNTKASVWSSIQTALTEAGFIVANVSALDKKQGSFKAVTTLTAVKQDLVISAYKPNGGFEERFEEEAKSEEGVWDFIQTHLKYLPVTKKLGLDFVAIPERDPRILYDQVIAYYVRKGYNVPIDSQDFQLGLSQRFPERDGMYFLPEQVAEYDRKKMIGGGRPLQQSLFISDEASAIEWLRSLLRDKPQSFQDINPLFMKEIGGWSKSEIGLELSTLLEQNFLAYDGKGPVPDQIHSYLSSNWKDMRNLPKEDPALVAKAKNRWYVPDPNKAGDLEKLREKALLKEFEEYKQAKKKLKIFRLEAVRAGFKKAWQERDYKVIIAVAEKIPNNVLEEDPKLLMWYDQAVTRVGDE